MRWKPSVQDLSLPSDVVVWSVRDLAMLARFVRHRWESFKAGVVLVATLAPPVLLGMAAHDLAVTRYLERHLRDAGATSEALQPDDVIAVSGRISAMPVRMDEGTPQFEGALMVVR